MRFIHTSDVHLHPNYPERLDAFKTVFQSAVDSSCQSVVIAGDLFDNELSAHQMRPEVRSLFEGFPNLKIYIVPGNHDANAYNEQFDYGRNVSIICNKPFQETPLSGGEARLISIPYQSNRIEPILSQVSSRDDMPTLVVTHGSFFHQRWSYVYQNLKVLKEGNDCAIFPEDLKGRGFSYVALGHWHQPTVPPIECEMTKVAYCGTPYPMAKNEVGRRQAAVVELSVPDKTSVKFIDLPGIPYHIRKRHFVVIGNEATLLDEIQRYLQEENDQDAMLTIEVDRYLEQSEPDFRNNLEQLASAQRGKWKEVEIGFKAVRFPLGARPAIERFLKRITTEELRLDTNIDGIFPEAELGALASELLTGELDDLKVQAIHYGLQSFQWALGR